MNLLTTVKGLINEIASLNDIEKSIRDRKVVIINYDGKEPGGKGYRTIEPVCVGRSKGGNNMVLRAWDTEGASHTATIGENHYLGGDYSESTKYLLIS